ncbi:probable WD repeat-containing protein 19 [Coccomyxa sp. Obi]|nr:probable WD repeat-containing protein 19 [Coccomyxa sp. Obi]
MAWSPCGTMLAVAVGHESVLIQDRHGAMVDEIALQKPVKGSAIPGPELQWDPKGESLAILCHGQSQILLYTLAARTTVRLDSGLTPRSQEITCLAWATSHRTLAAGTRKGTLVLFSMDEERRDAFTGIVVLVSADSKETGGQLQVYSCFASALTALALCAAAGRAAVASGGKVAVLGVAASVQEVLQDGFTIPGDQIVDRLSYSADGQLLAVASLDGPVHIFLAALPALCAVRDCCLACLTNLREVTISDYSPGAESKLVCPVSIEPGFLALGNHHLAIGTDRQVWYYLLPLVAGSETKLLGARVYPGPVEDLQLNASHAAVLTGGRVTIHTLGALTAEANEAGSFELPPPHVHADVMSIALTGHFLIQLTGGPMVAVLWDAVDRNVFLLSDRASLHVYVVEPTTITGPGVKHLGSQPALPESVPVLLVGGRLVLQHTNGSCESIILETHKPLEAADVGVRGNERLLMRLRAAVSIGRMQQALETATMLNTSAGWQVLAAAAVHCMDVKLAAECYHALENEAMADEVEKLDFIEEKELRSGHLLSLVLGDHDKAQVQELQENYTEAHQSYTDALAFEEEGQEECLSETDRALCKAGLARTAILLGDFSRGRDLAASTGDADVLKKCAALLEELQQGQAAAQLYEMAGEGGKAAALYLKAGLVDQASAIMAQQLLPELQLPFGQALEGAGRYADAVAAYQAAGAETEAVRVLLHCLQDRNGAAALVARSGDAGAAALMAQQCQASGEYAEAVRYLMLAGQQEAAFQAARLHDAMPAFVDGLPPSGPAAREGCERACLFYEERALWEASAELRDRFGDPEAAVRLYLKAGGDAVYRAIETVGRAGDSALGGLVADHLESFPPAESAALLSRLYLALGRHQDAAAAALHAAYIDREAGNYKMAHETIVAAWRAKEGVDAKLFQELRDTLVLLHSYILIKPLVRLGNHEGAARMLLRVCASLEAFPCHVVPILTTAVVECSRAGLSASAYDCAAMLMRPEHRDAIAPTYRRKIEGIVRKRDWGEDPEEAQVACVFCGAAGPASTLDCLHCRSTIPFCLATGMSSKRMVRGDWTECPACGCPANGLAFATLLAVQPQCPLCGAEVSATDLQSAHDVAQLDEWVHRLRIQ